jgi:hypothetical protein
MFDFRKNRASGYRAIKNLDTLENWTSSTKLDHFIQKKIPFIIFFGKENGLA